jgi:hypothetical protein
MTQFHSQCRSRYEVLVQKKKKASRASTSISGASQMNEPRSVDNVQLETQIQEAGPSSAPTRPRPRARTKKTSAAAPGVMDQTEEQPIERPRPRAKPRAKSTRTTEQGDVVESEPMPELGGDKEKRKQKATAASSESRKRKSRVVDDTGDNPPTKRKKSGLNAQPKSIATGKNLPVDNTTPEELPRPQLLETLISQGDGDTVTQVQVPAKDSRMKHTASATEPTRRQPSRAVSRKSIS